MLTHTLKDTVREREKISDVSEHNVSTQARNTLWSRINHVTSSSSSSFRDNVAIWADFLDWHPAGLQAEQHCGGLRG